MCGICGLLDFSGARTEQGVIERMTNTLRHRGPDDRGTCLDGPVALGHTRLSIIDLSDAGHQPMVSRDGNVVLVYNGEIYNFRQLRRVLESGGASFRGRSDSEVVLQAYLAWGVEAFRRFKGMFALAIWDRGKHVLHLARDRFGIKPLYYYPLEDGLIFGSEVKALLASGRITPAMNNSVLPEYLFYGTALGEHSLFAGVRRLLPGHHAAVDESGITITSFASLEEIEPVGDDLETATREVRSRLEEAVRSHLISDVPVGVFLSGGIDSSAIVALASLHTSGKLQTYSVGFDFEQGVNELPKARKVAEYFGTDHHELHVSGSNMPEVIETLVHCHDEPFADAADLPLYLLCREIGGSPKVILQGDGGDEIFAGYRRYNVLAAKRFWKLAGPVGGSLAGMFPISRRADRLRRFLQAAGHPDPAMRMALLLTVESLHRPPTRVLSADFRKILEEVDPFARYREMQSRFSRLDPVQRMLYTDCGIILPDIFLEKVDKSTMAQSMEIRVPLLDTDLTRYVMGLPSSMKVKRGQKKWILRRAMRGIVPDEILDGKKTGFGVPFEFWLRDPLADYLRSVLLDSSVDRWGIFDSREMERAIEEHVSMKRDNGFLLYKLLLLVLWRTFYLS